MPTYYYIRMIVDRIMDVFGREFVHPPLWPIAPSHRGKRFSRPKARKGNRQTENTFAKIQRETKEFSGGKSQRPAPAPNASFWYIRIRNRMSLQATQMKTAKCRTRLSKWIVSGPARAQHRLHFYYSFVVQDHRAIRQMYCHIGALDSANRQDV